MDHAKLIAVRMEEARDARGISVAELARRASIDRKRLWYILDGQRQMRADEFVRLCAVMGLDMQFFLTPEMREELSYRRKLTIEEYGTGLCGLPTMREKGEVRCNIWRRHTSMPRAGRDRCGRPRLSAHAPPFPTHSQSHPCSHLRGLG